MLADHITILYHRLLITFLLFSYFLRHLFSPYGHPYTQQSEIWVADQINTTGLRLEGTELFAINGLEVGTIWCIMGCNNPSFFPHDDQFTVKSTGVYFHRQN